MASVLVVGGPGAGKSSVAEELRRRGLRSVDADFVLARWERPDGSPVPFPAEAPSMEWIQRHRWHWVAERVDQVLAESPLVVCGTAANMGDYLARFDLLILLQVDELTMTRRLSDPRRTNDFGKSKATLQWSLDWRPQLEAEMLAAGAHPVDARQPLAAVTDEVIHLATTAGIPLPVAKDTY
ncbi:hypothetical protein GCM10029976_057660 [Kribbella albertanoniae]|uniref:Shikimate kinase n=1 Tax=Kribbella albertanoniae TaxID=1266829 RepID=A0A4R4P043_9ACTN|nr:AAA family ATPase [Kribbella albertanoniae]TDC15189.1 hypothetical protein E1261_40755 [Kribbella albertanoniae]